MSIMVVRLNVVTHKQMHYLNIFTKIRIIFSTRYNEDNKMIVRIRQKQLEQLSHTPILVLKIIKFYFILHSFLYILQHAFIVKLIFLGIS